MSQDLLKMMFYTSFKMHPWPSTDTVSMLYDTYKGKEVPELKELILTTIPGDENMLSLIRDALMDIDADDATKITLMALNTKYGQVISRIAENADDSKKLKSLIKELIMEISK